VQDERLWGGGDEGVSRKKNLLTMNEGRVLQGGGETWGRGGRCGLGGLKIRIGQPDNSEDRYNEEDMACVVRSGGELEEGGEGSGKEAEEKRGALYACWDNGRVCVT